MVGLKSGPFALIVANRGARGSLFLCPAVAHGRGRRTSNTTPRMGDLVAGRQSQVLESEVACHPVAWFELSPWAPAGNGVRRPRVAGGVWFKACSRARQPFGSVRFVYLGV